MKCGKGKEVDHIDNNPKNNNHLIFGCIPQKESQKVPVKLIGSMTRFFLTNMFNLIAMTS